MRWKLPQSLVLPIGLPGFSGRLRMAQLTDLHFGVMTHPGLLEAAVIVANDAKADVTVLTGDFVARSRLGIRKMEEVLRHLKGRKLAVLGNHDHWVDAEAVRKALENVGIEVLMNSWTWVEGREGRLPIVGIDDAVTHHEDIDGACLGLPTPAICLSHDPRAAPRLWEKGVGLVLSGHTHGGQIHVGEPTKKIWKSLLATPHLSGWYREGEGQVYVCPGVGSAVFPWRLGAPTHRQVAILDISGGEIRDPLVPVAQATP